MRFDGSFLDGTRATDMWQLLDVRLLKDHLIQSVWYLNSQPPLFNLYAGLVLHLPAGPRTPFEVACALAWAWPSCSPPTACCGSSRCRCRWPWP